MRHDMDVYLRGLNTKLRADSGIRRVDPMNIYAANAIIGQNFGQGGGDEARR